MTLIKALVPAVRAFLISYLLISLTIPKLMSYKDAEDIVYKNTEATHSLTEELTPLTIELQGLKDKFSNESIRVYNSNFEVADTISGFSCAELKKIVGYRQEPDGNLSEVITVTDPADTEYFTDTIDKIMYVLKYDILAELKQAIINSNIIAESIEIDADKKIMRLTVASIDGTAGTVVGALDTGNSSELAVDKTGDVQDKVVIANNDKNLAIQSPALTEEEAGVLLNGEESILKSEADSIMQTGD